MSDDKEFVEWIDSNNLGILLCHVWGYTNKDMEKCWQASAVRATDRERKRILSIIEDRFAELSRLKRDDNSDSCWEDYNYSQKELRRLFEQIKN